MNASADIWCEATQDTIMDHKSQKDEAHQCEATQDTTMDCKWQGDRLDEDQYKEESSGHGDKNISVEKFFELHLGSLKIK